MANQTEVVDALKQAVTRAHASQTTAAILGATLRQQAQSRAEGATTPTEMGGQTHGSESTTQAV